METATVPPTLVPTIRTPRTVRRAGRLTSAAKLAGFLMLLAACSPERVLGSKTLPPDVSDPERMHTPEGAMATYRGALIRFRHAFGGEGEWSLVYMTGLLTDELQDGNIGLVGVSSPTMELDGRMLPEATDPSLDDDASLFTYSSLQNTRGQITEALGALEAFAPDAPPDVRARLYAMEAYTEIFLADLFCSGVPLSTLDFDGDYVYRAGSSTEEVYEQAIAHFDSSLGLASDSVEVMRLARVGKARALLAIGRAAEAAQALADIPDTFRYEMRYAASGSGGELGSTNFGRSIGGTLADGHPSGGATMSDREGGNGLPYLSGRDPRVESSLLGYNTYGWPHYVPAKYSSDGDTPIVLASGVEARLIEAEAQLQANDPHWLTTLNALRTDGTYDTQPDPADSTQTDTLWHAGTGGVAGLRPLEDPGTPEARVDLVFHERAFWLYLTGQRQGDLRRLIRQYGRDPESVYPTGAYPGLTGRYGSYVTASIPAEERAYNPEFRGCLSRGA